MKFSEHLQRTASLNRNLHSQALFLFWFYWLIIQFHDILYNFSICLLLRWLFAVIVISPPKKKKKERKRTEKKLPCKVQFGCAIMSFCCDCHYSFVACLFLGLFICTGYLFFFILFYMFALDSFIVVMTNTIGFCLSFFLSLPYFYT